MIFHQHCNRIILQLIDQFCFLSWGTYFDVPFGCNMLIPGARRLKDRSGGGTDIPAYLACRNFYRPERCGLEPGSLLANY